MAEEQKKYVRWFEDLDSGDVPLVGGKNASLGEMLQVLKEKGVRVPDGFATTSEAYRAFLNANNLEGKVRTHLDELQAGNASLQETGKKIRRLFRSGEFSQEITDAIVNAYHELSERYDVDELDVAVR